QRDLVVGLWIVLAVFLRQDGRDGHQGKECHVAEKSVKRFHNSSLGKRLGFPKHLTPTFGRVGFLLPESVNPAGEKELRAEFDAKCPESGALAPKEHRKAAFAMSIVVKMKAFVTLPWRRTLVNQPRLSPALKLCFVLQLSYLLSGYARPEDAK